MVRRELVRNAVPTTVGGGTVAFADLLGHRYLDDPVAREEGGTPRSPRSDEVAESRTTVRSTPTGETHSGQPSGAVRTWTFPP